ncbi:aminodeoxychorismate lyase [Streptomonospora sediminis]
MPQQQNGTIWIDHEQADWDEARIPLMSDALLRGLSVFDGMVARRRGDGGLALIAPDRHLDRLERSCAVLGLAVEHSREELLRACVSCAAAEAGESGDVYVRPMVVGTALTPRARAASVTVAAFRREAAVPAPITMRTSSWRRPGGDAMPPGVKAVGNYQLTRLARMESAQAGGDDSLLLNRHGRVAEAAGAAVLVEDGGRVASPPEWEDCLESVTVALLAKFARREGIELSREPVSRSRVYGAAGLAVAGTLSDVTMVHSLDHRDYGGDSPLLGHLRSRYLAAAAGTGDADLLEAVEVK